jgi:hypothetical protein
MKLIDERGCYAVSEMRSHLSRGAALIDRFATGNSSANLCRSCSIHS